MSDIGFFRKQDRQIIVEKLKCFWYIIFLTSLYEQLANEEDIAFLDSSQYVTSSEIDGIHLDFDQLEKLATAVSLELLPIITA